MRITVRVEKMPTGARRRLDIVVEGDTGYFSSSSRDWGNDAPLQTIVERRDLPAGEYTVSAYLVSWSSDTEDIQQANVSGIQVIGR